MRDCSYRPSPTRQRPAGAVTTCGAVLTTDAYLTADLTCTDGLRITGNLSLDLRHHTLTGPGSGVGVAIFGGSKLQLSNGTIQRWGYGMMFDAVAGDYPGGSATVSDVSFISNGSETWGGMYSPLQFTRAKFLNNGTGIAGPWYGSVTVTRSLFRGNQYAANMFDSTLTMTGSIVDHNGTGVNCANLSCRLNGNSISNNTTGVSVRYVGQFDVTKNIFRGNGIGIDAGGYSFIQLSDNVFARNTTGVKLDQSFGPIERNVFTGNEVGLASANRSDTYFLITTIEHNFAMFNGDGFSITGTNDQVKSNTANRNHRWGINAPDAIDLGGNRAIGQRQRPAVRWSRLSDRLGQVAVCPPMWATIFAITIFAGTSP